MDFASLLNLSKELECPVCQHFMVGEISLCRKGHSICVKCKNELKNEWNRSICPLCRELFATGRNYTLEKIAAGYIFQCHNKGCEEKLVAKDINNHELECNFRLDHCILAFNGCTWYGTHSNLKLHILEKHSSYTQNAFVPVSFTDVSFNRSVQSLVLRIVFINEYIFSTFFAFSEITCFMSCMSSKYSKTVKYMLTASFNDLTDSEAKMMCSVPCISRCDIKDVFDGHKVMFCKEMMNCYFKQSNGIYSLNINVEDN